jgi:hypothetical protein
MTPPRIATCFLMYLGCDPNNEAVLGDLVEQYHAGRSRIWYRSQVLRAVIVSVYERLRERPFLWLWATASGPVLAMLLATLLQRVLLPYAVIGPLSYRAFSVVLFAACAASVHLTLSVARFFQRQGRAFMLVYLSVFCPALYLYWWEILIRFHDAQTTRSIVVGGLLNYVWMMTTLATVGVAKFRRSKKHDLGAL